MDSTDSSNGENHHNGPATSCGLVSSLFPNSCRGRAEAFARRLHRRLTSLGGNGTIDDEDNNDLENLTIATANSWLEPQHKSTNETTALINHVHECQPRHSPESDLYYDFDLSPEQEHDEGADTGSPDEVVSAVELATLLVNHSELLKANHNVACHCAGKKEPAEDENRDPESGYVFSSPLDGTPSDEGNSNEAYYDPESSDADKTHSNDYVDPITTTETDTCHMTNAKSAVHKPPGRRRIDLNEQCKTDDNTESNVSNGLDEHEPKDIPAIPCSSDDSLNDVASSLDTTSASHESLWSTFDDSTVSLDNSPTLSRQNLRQLIVTKSHSDSELIPRNVRVPEINLDSTSSSDEVDLTQQRVYENGEINEKFMGINGDHEIGVENYSIYRSSIDIPGALAVECLLERTPKLEDTLMNEVNLAVEETCEQVEQMTKLFRKITSSPGDSFDKENSEDIVNCEETKDDEEEEEEDRPQRLRRCSSLKTGKTPPGTPGRKKIVRFADVLGLDLADVRTFLDEVPKIPNSAYFDLIYDDVFQKDTSPSVYDNNQGIAGRITNTMPISVNNSGMKPERMLVALFQQPGGLTNFLDLVRDRQVCLENIIVQDPITFCIQGSVRVRNLDFHKSVHIRYTLDCWRNFSDLQALYVNNSCDGFSDKFTFELYCHTLKVGERLELAVRFQCKGTQYWDNNDGANYCFQCLPSTPVVSYIPITASHTSNVRDWSPAFY